MGKQAVRGKIQGEENEVHSWTWEEGSGPANWGNIFGCSIDPVAGTFPISYLHENFVRACGTHLVVVLPRS